MRLAEFIASNVESILTDWVSFARSIWPTNSPASPDDLRDSAEMIIRAVVDDMAQHQTLDDQFEKSVGRREDGPQSGQLDDASTLHGAARVGSAFTIHELVAEYRALRASVLRQWRASHPVPEALDLDDITRFNESIDESLSRAVSSFAHRLDTSRNMFLAILGHDLRNPLSAITLSAKLALRGGTEDQTERLTQIVSSAGAVSGLVTDLIDFTRCTMGVILPLAPAPLDLKTLGDEVVRESRATNPQRQLRFDATGNLVGQWDTHRLRQVLGNLLGNAMQHGSPSEPVTLRIDGSANDSVVITVHNAGPPIPPEELPIIFDPLVRGKTSVTERSTPGSIGLGLYIAREIVLAHRGTIALTSTATDGTTATVRLPR